MYSKILLKLQAILPLNNQNTEIGGSVVLVSAAVFLQLSCWSEKYTEIESNDRYAKNMKLQSQNVALGTKQGRSLQMIILKKLVEFL